MDEQLTLFPEPNHPESWDKFVGPGPKVKGVCFTCSGKGYGTINEKLGYINIAQMVACPSCRKKSRSVV